MDQTPPPSRDTKASPDLVARAKAIILSPSAEWVRIAAERDEPMQVFMRYAVPLAAIGPVAQFIGGQVFGTGFFGITFRPSLMSGLTSAIISYVLSLASLWLIAFIASKLAPKFAGREDFPAAFRLCAYAMTAAWLSGIFGLMSALSVLGLLGLYSLYLFYKGAVPVMGVPQEKALGYTAVTVLIAIIVNLLIGVMVASMTGFGGMADNRGGDMSINLGQLGSIDSSNDGDQVSIDMGPLGRIESDGSGTVVRMTGPDGEEMTIRVDENG